MKKQAMKWQDFLETKDNHNEAVSSYFDQDEKVLVSFVRHSGCTYCREMLQNLSDFQKSYEKNAQNLPFRLLIVHMSSFSKGDEMLKKFDLKNVRHISDPTASIYKVFGLKRGSLSQLFGLKAVLRGFSGLTKYGIGMLDGDGMQMPGVFLVEKSGIVKSFIHKSVADKVDYNLFLTTS